MKEPRAILDVPPAWRAVVSELNGGRIPDGTIGIRDLDAPCEEFLPHGAEPLHGMHTFSDCETDGHYICEECVHISERALRHRRDQCEDCGEKLVHTVEGTYTSRYPDRCPVCEPTTEREAEALMKDSKAS